MHHAMKRVVTEQSPIRQHWSLVGPPIAVPQTYAFRSSSEPRDCHGEHGQIDWIVSRQQRNRLSIRESEFVS